MNLFILKIPVFDVAGIMLGKFFGLAGSASFHLLGRNSRPNLMCRNLGAMGNYSTCCNDSSFTDISLVKHGGIHSDECAFSNGSSMNDGTMSHRYIILQDARHRTGLMDACTILYIHSVSTSDGIHVRAQYRTIPDAAVITKNTVAGQYGVLSDKTILSPLRIFPSTVFIIAILNIYLNLGAKVTKILKSPYTISDTSSATNRRTYHIPRRHHPAG